MVPFPCMKSVRFANSVIETEETREKSGFERRKERKQRKELQKMAEEQKHKKQTDWLGNWVTNSDNNDEVKRFLLEERIFWKLSTLLRNEAHGTGDGAALGQGSSGPSPRLMWSRS